jgi:hypothetical protein
VKRFALLFFFCLPAAAQFSVGVIGGIPFNDLVSNPSTNAITFADKSGRYTIGPTVQLGLPLGFRLEADALYRPAEFTSATFGAVGNFSASQWRIPVLLQYRFGAPILKPFVEAGYSYDHINIKVPTFNTSYSITSHHGFVLGAGVDFKIPLFRISPEIRFTRDVDSGTNNLLQLNQAEFLIGIRF